MADPVTTQAATTQPATQPVDAEILAPAAETGIGMLDVEFLGNKVWQWLVLVGIIVGAVIVGKIISAICRRSAKRVRDADKKPVTALLLESLATPLFMATLAIGLYAASFFITIQVELSKDFTWHMRPFWVKLCQTIAALAVGAFLFKAVSILEYMMTRLTEKTKSTFDDSLVPVVRKVLRVIVVIAIALFIAQTVFQWDMPALLAGLGIGGLAFALAAKDMLANLFGSVTIFSDRPFKKGERVKIGGFDGVIEDIGFRSTKLRTLAGHLVTLPNSVVVNEGVENISQRPSIKRVLNVTITYDTPPEKVELAVNILREMLEERTKHFPKKNPPRVYFSDFNAESLNIVVYYWFKPPDWWKYLQFNHEFNMELLTRYNAEGIEFAFPTQTLYVKKS